MPLKYTLNSAKQYENFDFLASLSTLEPGSKIKEELFRRRAFLFDCWTFFYINSKSQSVLLRNKNGLFILRTLKFRKNNQGVRISCIG